MLLWASHAASWELELGVLCTRQELELWLRRELRPAVDAAIASLEHGKANQDLEDLFASAVNSAADPGFDLRDVVRG